ncbi:hypothetical protein ACFZAV_20145 [Streptomyces sp. NPDC008343]|uniref:hypothetical protein n=1 Tax=Streptomyces sp. NPDC008343 TaxID=3364828 RepID=UPI0036E4C5CD
MDTTIDLGLDALQLLNSEEARLYTGDLDSENCGTFTCAMSCGYSCEITCNVSNVF